MAIELSLLGRAYCHLCHDLEVALAPLAERFGVAVNLVDIDADESLLARYDELVPVLLHGDVELCHYFLDVGRVTEYLERLQGEQVRTP